MRTIIDLPEDMVEALDRVGGHEKLSRAALIRAAIGVYLKEKSTSLNESKAFGIWKSRGVDGVQYQDQVRSDWAS